MARSDLLINLVKAGVGGDTHTLKRTVDAIVAEERAKQHNTLADRLERTMRAMPPNGLNAGLRQSQDVSLRVRDYIAEVAPRRRLEDLVLTEVTRLGVNQLIEEQHRASLLRSHSIEPRHRLLLVGPPGNGKTSLAEAIAERLAIPFFVVRYESMIGSFLGETASRMKRVFDYVRTTPCVLFFDEFDAVGKERGDTHETGEIKRVVSSLLMQIDELPSYTVIIAATNHAELLDRAAWRRFQLRLTLPSPTHKDLATFLTVLTQKADIQLGATVSTVIKALGKVSYSETEEFFLDIVRRQVLALGERPPEDIAREQIKLWAERAQNMAMAKGRMNGRTSSS